MQLAQRSNQTEYYLLSKLLQDPILPYILVYNIFPSQVPKTIASETLRPRKCAAIHGRLLHNPASYAWPLPHMHHALPRP